MGRLLTLSAMLALLGGWLFLATPEAQPTDVASRAAPETGIPVELDGSPSNCLGCEGRTVGRADIEAAPHARSLVEPIPTTSLGGLVLGAEDRPVFALVRCVSEEEHLDAGGNLVRVDTQYGVTETDHEGRFRVDGLPAGSYTVHLCLWGPKKDVRGWYAFEGLATGRADHVLRLPGVRPYERFEVAIRLRQPIGSEEPMHDSRKSVVLDAEPWHVEESATVEVVCPTVGDPADPGALRPRARDFGDGVPSVVKLRVVGYPPVDVALLLRTPGDFYGAHSRLPFEPVWLQGLRPGDPEREVTLARAPRLTGHVKLKGHPVRAYVTARALLTPDPNAGRDARRRDLDWATQATWSDGEGRFEIDGLPAGAVSVRVDSKASLDAWHMSYSQPADPRLAQEAFVLPEPRIVELASDSNVDIDVEPAASLTVEIRMPTGAERLGLELSDTRLWRQDPDGTRVPLKFERLAAADRDLPSLQIAGLPEGVPLHLVATLAGFEAAASTAVPRSEPHVLQLIPTFEWTAWTARVVDAADRPARAKVRVHRRGEAAGTVWTWARTNDDGMVTLQLPANQAFDAVALSGETQRSDVVDADPKHAPQTLRLKPCTCLHGRVIADAQGPLGAFRVRAVVEGDPFLEIEPTEAADDGYFEVYAPRHARVLLVAWGVDPVADVRVAVLQATSDSSESFQLKLRPAKTATGALVTPAGGPIEAAEVRAIGQYSTRYGRTDESGRFRIEGLPEERYRIVARTRAGLVFEAEGATETEFRLVAPQR